MSTVCIAVPRGCSIPMPVLGPRNSAEEFDSTDPSSVQALFTLKSLTCVYCRGFLHYFHQAFTVPQVITVASTLKATVQKSYA